MSVEVDDSEVRRKISDLTKKLLPELLREGMKRACIICETEAKRNCPKDDGTLRASITHDVEELGTGVVGYIGTNVEYAPYVHQGTGIYAVNGDGRKEVPWRYQTSDGQWHTTSGQRPNPFLQDAIDAKQGEILEAFRSVDTWGVG